MQKTVMAAALVLFIAGAAWAQDIAGDWEGTLHAGVADLRLVLHINKIDSGTKSYTRQRGSERIRNSRQLDFAQGFEAQPGRGCRAWHVRRQGVE
jgi:hypothetical protein